MKEPIPATITESQSNPKCAPAQVFDHPAFGTVSLSIVTGSHGSTMFGSDLGHNQWVRITVSHAEKVRDLSRDWIHPGESVVVFELSHAQFAQFITSHGNGSGTPCTLRYAANPVHGIEEIPGILKEETKHETFRREIQEASKKHLEEIRKHIDSLGAMVDSGKLKVSEVRELQKELNRHADYLPGTMSFVVKSAEEALEKATSDAKIEVEAFIAASAQRIGLTHINDLAKLENKQ
jgi:hypothetical protein